MGAQLDTAILLATHAHAGQLDKGGQPYILHCLRVMAGLGVGADEESRCAAVLHDILEDTRTTKEYLADLFAPAVVEAIDVLTKRGRSYADYIERVRSTPGLVGAISRRVKLADLRDNLDTARHALALAHGCDPSVIERLVRRYREALHVLELEGLKRQRQCPWCAEGNPRVRSSVNEKAFVHTDTPIGRVVCTASDPAPAPQGRGADAATTKKEESNV